MGMWKKMGVGWSGAEISTEMGRRGEREPPQGHPYLAGLSSRVPLVGSRSHPLAPSPHLRRLGVGKKMRNRQ